MTGETDEDLQFHLEPRTFKILLFLLLILFLPIYILVGFIPTVTILSVAVQSSGAFSAFAWFFAGAGVLVCGLIAHALTGFVYGLKPPQQFYIAALIVLAPPIAGALPIYGAAGHGSIQWTNMYVGYAEMVDELGR
jgi:hypothetical protein